MRVRLITTALAGYDNRQSTNTVYVLSAALRHIGAEFRLFWGICFGVFFNHLRGGVCCEA